MLRILHLFDVAGFLLAIHGLDVCLTLATSDGRYSAIGYSGLNYNSHSGMPMVSFVQLALHKVRHTIKKEGVARTARLCVTRPLSLYREFKQQQEFDRDFGLDTSEEINLSRLRSIESPNWKHGQKYQPTPVGLFHEMIRGLDVRYEDFVFIDFGSGKGRTLFLAADYPFNRIIGVEYSKHLHEIAELNIGLYQSPTRQCTDIRSICADVTTFLIPPEPAVLYFFNPFDDVVMKQVIRSIEASWRKSPRKLIAVYYNPVHLSVFSHSLLSRTSGGGNYAIIAFPDNLGEEIKKAMPEFLGNI